MKITRAINSNNTYVVVDKKNNKLLCGPTNEDYAVRCYEGAKDSSLEIHDTETAKKLYPDLFKYLN